MASATAVAISASAAVRVAASATMASAAASAAGVYILSVKAFCELLLGSFSYCEHLSLEMECLARHLMVEVHLHAVLAYLHNYARDHATHWAYHRDCVADNEKVLADLAVNLESCLRKVDDS